MSWYCVCLPHFKNEAKEKFFYTEVEIGVLREMCRYILLSIKDALLKDAVDDKAIFNVEINVIVGVYV